MIKAKITISAHTFVESLEEANAIAELLIDSVPLTVKRNGFHIVIQRPDYGVTLYD